MTLSPDLERLFQDGTERAAAHNLLSSRDSLLRAIESLARTPAEQWSAAEYSSFPRITNGVPDEPPHRLARWASIFAEELSEVHELSTHRPLDDRDLRRALYFAGRLLATVTDLPIDVVDGFAVPRTAARYSNH